MKPSQAIFFAVVLLLFLGANFYVFYRIWKMMPPTAVGRTILVAGALLLTGSFFLSMLARNGGLPIWLNTALYRIGTAWVFIFLYLLIIFLIADLLRVTRLLPMQNVMYGSWLSLGVLAAAVSLVFVLGNIAYHNKKRVELAVETGKPFDGPVRIVAASDLHLGYGISRKELSRWVDMINSENPDIILFAGDVIDNTTYPLRKLGYAEELRRLNATHGVWLAPGNHEYISGLDESLRFFEEAGINVLRDSVAIFDGRFCVAGRDDMINPDRKSVAELTKDAHPDLPLVLIDHQPYRLEEAEAAGVDLQISGHTHRGQVWPVTWITDAIFERSHGHVRKGGTNYWISSGLGLWGGKFRIGSRSEYIVAELISNKE